MRVITSPQRQKENLTLPIVSSALMTLFLFFIDEGLYSFQWILDLGSWIAFTMYAGAMFLGQLIISKTLFSRSKSKNKVWLSLLIGLPLGLALVLGFFSSRMI